LAKFSNVSRYCNWDDSDKLFHIGTALEGPAGQVLWDVGPQTSFDGVVSLLQSRFGHKNQAERFRAEVRARRRKPGETLQELYQDLCRLFALAYPHEPHTAASSLMARDAFLDALNDDRLRVDILQWEPETLKAALNLACKYEAFKMSAPKVILPEQDDPSRRVNKQVRSVKMQGLNTETTFGRTGYSDRISDLTKQVAGLQGQFTGLQGELTKQVTEFQGDLAKQVTQLTQLVMQMRCDAQSREQKIAAPDYCAPTYTIPPLSHGGQPVSVVYGNDACVLPPGNASGYALPLPTLSGGPAGPHQSQPRFAQQATSYGKRGNDRRGNRSNDTCFKCKRTGHWSRECDQPDGGGDVYLNVVVARSKPAEVYAKASLRGKPLVCLLDSGCDRSIIGHKYVSEMTIRSTKLKLRAANGTDVPILGEVDIDFMIEGHPVRANVAVSDVVEELILGSDWLSETGCTWDFGSGKLTLNGHITTMHKR